VPKILVAGAVLECSHGGQIRIDSGNDKLKVGGKAALTAGMEAGLAFAASDMPPMPNQLVPCPITTPAPKGAPCVTSPLQSGSAAKLNVGGTAVLLDSANGQTINAISPGTWRVSSAGQTKMEAS
jgi:hypothetical protein